MVTAIVIPIICLYFYWLTKREMKAQEQKWHSIGQVSEEYVVKGKVISVNGEKQKFHFSRHIYVYTLVILADRRRITAIKSFPVKGNQIPTLSVNTEDTVLVYGGWREHQFMISSIERQK